MLGQFMFVFFSAQASKVQNVLITGHSKVLAIGNIAGGTYSVGSDEKQDLIEH